MIQDNDNNLQELILSRLDLSKEMTKEQVQEIIDEQISQESKKRHLEVSARENLRREIYHSIRQLGILQELIENPAVTEIMVNGIQGIFVEENGRLKKLDLCFDSVDKLRHVIWQITAGCNRVVNDSSPIVDARLPDGSRVNVVLDPIAVNGPILTIRRFPQKPITMEQLIKMNSISEECSSWLENLVKKGRNILVCGGTGSGKTTFLNVLSGFIPSTERVITIEDSAELQIKNIPNLVSLETRNANVEGCKEITIRDLIKASLRMRPESIKIIQGKLKHNKKRFPIPGAFLQHVFGDLIPLIC